MKSLIIILSMYAPCPMYTELNFIIFAMQEIRASMNSEQKRRTQSERDPNISIREGVLFQVHVIGTARHIHNNTVLFAVPKFERFCSNVVVGD